MLPVLGESLTYVKDPLSFSEEKLTQHGGTCRSHLLLAPSVILAVTEENAKLIHSKKDLGWPRHFQKLVGRKALAMVNDPLHKKIRTLNSRAFADKQLDSYLPKLQKLSAKYLEDWVGKPSSDLHFEVKHYAFECGEAVVLGGEQVRSDSFMKLYDKTFEGLGCILPFDLPGFPFRECMKARGQLVEGFKELIQQKRRKLKDPVRMFRISTMLDTMLQTEGTDEEELLDFCIGMMFAAHDTTLCSVQSCLHWLKAFPALEQRLRKEVKDLWDGQAFSVNRPLLESMHQTRAFLQEVWRTTPPVQVVVRSLSEDTEVDGYLIPKGWSIYFAPAGRHSKAENFKEFSIERHLKDGKFLDSTFEPTYFNAFGGGSRMCIGYKFGRDEMLVFLLNFLHGYDLRIDRSDLKKFPFHFWRLTGSFQRLSHG